MGKRSFQKIPATIEKQIEECAGKPFVIFALVEVGPGDTFPNLPDFVVGDDTDKATPIQVLPDPSRGTWARRNVDGWEIPRKDLPMETKSFSAETPNFGDWSLGSHEVTWDREVYQRDFFPGYGTTILIDVVRRIGDRFTLSLELDRVFEGAPSDPRELRFALNVFQEAVGHSAIRPTDKPADSFIRSLQVDWELLPLGDRDAIIEQVRARFSPSPKEDRVLTERIDLLHGLKPQAMVTGTSGFARYIGAQFRDDFVVFENVRYGNAAYVMFENWEELSRLSRTELITSRDDFVRVIHRAGWKRRLRAIVQEYRHRGRP